MDQQQITSFAWAGIDWLVNAIPNLIAAILILVGGLLLSRWLARAAAHLLSHRARVDPTLIPVVTAIVTYGVIAVTGVAVLGQLGIQIASVIAVLGAVGLAVGLALQGTLSNVAAGFMLLWLRPFKAGDYIDAGGLSGTVLQVGLFTSELKTADGVFRFVPNSELWNKPLLNYNRLPTRKMDIPVGIGYDDDIGKAREVLLDLAKGDGRILDDPAPEVLVTQLGDSAVTVTLRAWAKVEDYWPAFFGLTEQSKTRIEQAGLSIPYPIRTVLEVPGKPKPRSRPASGLSETRAS
ncbi:MAG TPA: mechanosensitive ion channel domain-containing protein [Alphaproteobacteria bacterium]|nr:mechanosensitive ion channel domain-containing protein [Alphaproteobacteria bacterium]